MNDLGLILLTYLSVAIHHNKSCMTESISSLPCTILYIYPSLCAITGKGPFHLMKPREILFSYMNAIINSSASSTSGRCFTVFSFISVFLQKSPNRALVLSSATSITAEHFFAPSKMEANSWRSFSGAVSTDAGDITGNILRASPATHSNIMG